MNDKYYFKDELVILFQHELRCCGVNSQTNLTGYTCYLPEFQFKGCCSIIHGINCALHMQKIAVKKNMNIGKRMYSIAKLLELKRIAEGDRDLP